MLNKILPQTFNRILPCLQDDLRRSFWFVLALTICVGMTELAVAGIVSLLGVALASPQAVQALPLFVIAAEKFPVIAPFIQDQRSLLVIILVLVVGSVVIKNISTAYLTWKQGFFAQGVGVYLGGTLFKNMLSCPYLWHAEQGTAKLMANLNWRSTVSLYFTSMLVALSQFVIFFVMLSGIMLMAFTVGLMVAIATGLCAYATYKFSRQKAFKYGQEVSRLNVEEQMIVLPGVQGIRETLIYRLSNVLSDNYKKLLGSSVQYSVKQTMFPPLPSWLLETVGMLTLLGAVLYMNAIDTPLGRMTGTLTLIAAAAWRLMPAMNKMLGAIIVLRSYLPYVAQFMDMLDVSEKMSATKQVEQYACAFNDKIVIDDLSFCYPQSEKNSLEHLSLTIPKSKMLGIIGTSGAGKSTLVALLTGLLSSSSGEIRIDDTVLDPSCHEAWLKLIGYVPQSPYILHGSIAQNIAYQDWGQELNRGRVLECCKMAAVDFLDELSEGIDTVIGERGIRLSGGQLQRISIARALYGRPQLLIFDEATSALDMKNEQAIHQTILSLRHELTMIVIAHRLSTVQECDEIIWLEKGRIHRQGRPEIVLAEYEQVMKHREAGQE